MFINSLKEEQEVNRKEDMLVLCQFFVSWEVGSDEVCSVAERKEMLAVEEGGLRNEVLKNTEKLFF